MTDEERRAMYRRNYRKYTNPKSADPPYVAAVYCDGGVVGPNPSRLGGTWAWCWVDGSDIRIHQESGALSPEDLGLEVITNNHMELIAALKALASVGPDWRGVLHSDSLVTLSRLGKGSGASMPAFKGAPQWMVKEVFEVRRTFTKYSAKLVAGHPTRAELDAGTARRNGLPVSRHNCWCDQACTKAGLILKGSPVD